MEFFDHLLHELELPLANPVLIFSLILFIILLAPLLLKKIRIPGIIGLILSGVIIGPHGLGVLENNSAIELFSTIGLLYIMFIAGIELDIFEFKRNRYKSIGFGFLTFVFPLSIGVPVCYYILGYDLLASILTASMFATHTLVSYPIASKFGIAKNQAVAVTVGGTILTDTAVLVLLAVIIGSANGGLDIDFWIRLSIALGVFLLIIFLIIPRVAKWMFSHLEGEQTSHYVLVLSLVFLAAFLAEVAGVEPIIGAFMAGLALNRLIPHSSALMNRLEFVGNAIFIPFFLISVGMLVDISVLLKGPMAIIVAITLSIVALLGKYIAAILTQIIFKFSKNQRNLIFGLSSAHAAATLAVILVGYRAEIIDENILNGTIILILITCIIASFVTENASRKIVQEQELTDGEKSETDTVEENILIPIANFDSLEPLLDLTILLKSKKWPFTIHILSVVKFDDEAESNMVKIKKKLEYYVHYASATETNLEPKVTLDVNPAEGIIRISKEVFADILIMGWPKRGSFFNRIFGQTIEGIIRSVEKALFFCHLPHPINTTGKVKVVCPAAAELEQGFVHWLNKTILLSEELSSEIEFFCNTRAQQAIIKHHKESNSKVAISFHDFDNIEDFLVLAREIEKEDLFIVITAREYSVSYNNMLRLIPSNIDKHFTESNVILIYPSLIREEDQVDKFDEKKSLIFEEKSGLHRLKTIFGIKDAN